MKPYGCHNTKREYGYWVPVRSQDMIELGGSNIKVEFIKNVNTVECQYRKAPETSSDPRCAGCNK